MTKIQRRQFPFQGKTGEKNFQPLKAERRSEDKQLELNRSS